MKILFVFLINTLFFKNAIAETLCDKMAKYPPIEATYNCLKNISLDLNENTQFERLENNSDKNISRE